MRRVIQVLSLLLMAAGAVLLFQGARVFFESQFGQTEASRQFEGSSGAPANAPREAKWVRPRDGEAFAKLTIPRLDTELYIVEGDDSADLRRGPGHLRGTAMPGDDGNCVIAGHRDTHFRVLKDIRKGDDIILETSRGQFLYRVERTSIVPPSNTTPLQPTPGAELNLITCYPFYYVGAAPKRFVVEAQLAGAVAGPS
ncbi:MAG TPA: class D sortase [Bryobacteraceae bacterium]|nr:class D sortase [Bryobacteraceae bacterium]